MTSCSWCDRECRGRGCDLGPHVKKLVIANPKEVRVIAHAKIRTDMPRRGSRLYSSKFSAEGFGF
jgi:hypothetical protein